TSQTITEPVVQTATVAHTDVSCNGASTGTITISGAAGGVSPYTYSVAGSAYQVSGSFSGYAAGTYTVNIKDANNCIVALASQTITQPVVQTATVSHTDVLCNGASTGTITISSPSGGVSPYTYSVAGSAYQASGSFLNYPAGTYTVNIKDANNCIVALASQTITQPAVQTATVAHTDVLCNGASTGTITISSPSGGVSTYHYSVVRS